MKISPASHGNVALQAAVAGRSTSCQLCSTRTRLSCIKGSRFWTVQYLVCSPLCMSRLIAFSTAAISVAVSDPFLPRRLSLVSRKLPRLRLRYTSGLLDTDPWVALYGIASTLSIDAHVPIPRTDASGESLCGESLLNLHVMAILRASDQEPDAGLLSRTCSKHPTASKTRTKIIS